MHVIYWLFIKLLNCSFNVFRESSTTPYSTERALTCPLIQESMVILDLGAVYDTVCHNLTLIHLSITAVIQRLTSYISDRQVCVCINKQKSHAASASRGVPQGSLLRPLLFLI